jgi:hypothetical protein
VQYTLVSTFCEYTFCEYMFCEYTLRKYTFCDYTFCKVTMIAGSLDKKGEEGAVFNQEQVASNSVFFFFI